MRVEIVKIPPVVPKEISQVVITMELTEASRLRDALHSAWLELKEANNVAPIFEVLRLLNSVGV